MTEKRGSETSEDICQIILAMLKEGKAVWLRAAPGSGRSHTLRQVAARWSGHVLLADTSLLASVPSALAPTLLCIDDAPAGLTRAQIPVEGPVLATGLRPGGEWSVLDLPPLSEEEGVQLFLQHAPNAAAPETLRALARRLRDTPAAIVAAARRWPAEPISSILLEPSSEWPGLWDAFDALGEDEQDTLALIARLPNPVRHEGMVWCGRRRSMQQLVTAGWVTVSEPGYYQLSKAIADCIQQWRDADINPYFAWFAEGAREQLQDWTNQEVNTPFLRCGLWAALYETGRYHHEPWFFIGWALSHQQPQALLGALDEQGAAVPAVTANLCRTMVHKRLGALVRALTFSEEAVRIDDRERPHQMAWAYMELGASHIWLNDFEASRRATSEAIRRAEALGMTRMRVFCLYNLALTYQGQNQNDEARRLLIDARSLSAQLNLSKIQGKICEALGLLNLEEGLLGEARVSFQQGLRCSQNLPMAGQETILLGLRAGQVLLELVEAHLDAAEARCLDGLRLAEKIPAYLAYSYALQSVITALQGQLTRARHLHDLAEQATSVEDPFTIQLVAFWRAFLEWKAGDWTSALSRRRTYHFDESSLLAEYPAARITHGVLERIMADSGKVLVVAATGEWFQMPGQSPVRVDRHGAVMRVLRHLASLVEREPGAYATAETLIAAGWPGERIVPASARNRLAVTLSRLRKAGLRDVLQNAHEGWRLDPEVLLLHLHEKTWPLS
ncbi:MAG: tetratricopeptide repeat protein [Myxococcota bacterium]